MEPHRHCHLTHSIIAAGRCFFCKQPVIRGEVVPDGPDVIPTSLEWDLPRLVAMLTADGESGHEAISNVFCHKSDLFADLPFLRIALGHPDFYVRHFAEALVGRRARDFQPKDGEHCEQFLKAHPNEFALRIALLNYYFCRASHFPDDRIARERHVLWVIDNRPRSNVAGSPLCYPYSEDGESYQRARELWLRHTDTANVTTDVLGNAASFFTLNDRKLSKRLYRRAQDLEPDNPRWPERLAHLYDLDLKRSRPDRYLHDATQGLKYAEEAYRLSSDDLTRGEVLMQLVKFAFEAGDNARAREAAEGLLRLAQKEGRPPADLLHCAHTVLGRLALREENVASAKCHLAFAAEALATQEWVHAPGPRELWLARELLERGEQMAVINYLRRCSIKWEDPWHHAETWISDIENGKMPDFAHYLK